MIRVTVRYTIRARNSLSRVTGITKVLLLEVSRVVSTGTLDTRATINQLISTISQPPLPTRVVQELEIMLKDIALPRSLILMHSHHGARLHIRLLELGLANLHFLTTSSLPGHNILIQSSENNSTFKINNYG